MLTSGQRKLKKWPIRKSVTVEEKELVVQLGMKRVSESHLWALIIDCNFNKVPVNVIIRSRTRYCCMYVCMYVLCMYVWGGQYPAPAERPLLMYCASPLISPLLIPNFERSVGLCLKGRHNSHLAPWRTGPGNKILNTLYHNHIGYVWPFHFPVGTFHKWDRPLVPAWKGVSLVDSVP
jgi:hypothetical protein